MVNKQMEHRDAFEKKSGPEKLSFSGFMHNILNFLDSVLATLEPSPEDDTRIVQWCHVLSRDYPRTTPMQELCSGYFPTL